MATGIDFDYVEGFDASASWENLNEKTISQNNSSLIKKLSETAACLEKFWYNNDYAKASELVKSCWRDELAPGGWPLSFLTNNEETFAKYTAGSKPEWYGALSADDRKAYDLCLRCYQDFSLLKKPLEALQEIMMNFLLLSGFQCVRFTINLMDAGLDRAYYDQIDSEIRSVNAFLHWPWDRLEANARTAKAYYESNSGKIERSELEKGYRQARIKDYQNLLKMQISGNSFRPHADGVFSLDLNCVILMEVIDKYTKKIAELKDIENDMKRAEEDCHRVLAEINEIYGEIKADDSFRLIDALRKLIHALQEFAELSGTAYQSFKNHDDNEPYCYMKPLPVMSSLDGKYGLRGNTGDPMSGGTAFAKLYGEAVNAINTHCHEFVYGIALPGGR